MINLHRVKVISNDYDKEDVYIDDVKIKGVWKISTENTFDCVPSAEIAIYPSLVNLDVLRDVSLKVNVNNLKDAIMCIQLSLKLDDEFRNAMKAGIDSVLRDYRSREPDFGDKDLSDAIMEVIFDTEIS